MISPELLRRYPFFGALTSDQLKEVAMIADQASVESGVTVLSEGQPADALFILIDGSIDLFFAVEQEYQPNQRKEFAVGEVNPGEPFGISALIEPHCYSTTGRTAGSSTIIRIDGAALRGLCNKDQDLAYKLMQRIAKTAMERLAATRVQLAAAWA